MSKRVLVVEDNELNLKLFCDLLRAHEYTTEPVRDGREAVERARAFAPDLIVMDIQLPYVSGLELIETCKADAELSAIPIMAVTAYAGKEDEDRVRAAGAEAYVSKPISLMRFIGEVVALTAEDAAPPPEAAEAPLPEEESGETAAAEPAFAADLFPEEMPQGPPPEIAAAEDPLPEEEPAGDRSADDEPSSLAADDAGRGRGHGQHRAGRGSGAKSRKRTDEDDPVRMRGRRTSRRGRATRSLFDLGFLEIDMLAHDRVVFAEAQLFGLVPRILLGDVVEAGVGRADELDLDGCRLGHDPNPNEM